MGKSAIHLLNREVSWLHFNARVLQEAADPRNPLINRIKFLGIYANNLDEFIRVRVGTLSRMLTMPQKPLNFKQINPEQTLNDIHKLEEKYQAEFQTIYEGLVDELATHKVYFINETKLDKEQGEFVEQYFTETVLPHLFPIMLGNLQPDSLHGQALYLAVSMKKSDKSLPEKFAIIEVPVHLLGRFVVLPPKGDTQNLIFLDDVIRHCLHKVFPVFGYDGFKAFSLKFTRDAELDIDTDVSKSFLERMSESLKQRDSGLPVRFIFDEKLPSKLLDALIQKLQIRKKDTISVRNRYLNLRDLMQFPGLSKPELQFRPWPANEHRVLRNQVSILRSIQENDLLLHYPYQSFHYLIDLLREASLDPQVRSIKMTLYRVASYSNVVNALINAARNGKAVTVFLEVQARFDEQANIFWANEMQSHGVRVIQSIPGYKVHAKLLLIRRKENNKNVYYGCIGTGNFNETTAHIYTDVTLLTADKDITADVNSVFHLFESIYNTPRFKKLVVAPFQMRDHFVRLINNEIRNATAGEEAWIILKLNNLEDGSIARKLNAAAEAGVNVQMVVRGICVMTPDLSSAGSHFSGVSIVGRYLEHSRVMVFANKGKPLYYISSADWMERNFDHRIEVATPVLDPFLQKELFTLLQIALHDNTKARLLSASKPNRYYGGNPNLQLDSQYETYRYFKDQVV